MYNRKTFKANFFSISMTDSIRGLMQNEHQKIENIISEYRKSDKTTADAQYLFDKLIWMIKEHFFLEEKLIFSVYNLEIENHDNEELISQHKSILEILENMSKKKLEETSELLQNAEDELIAHSKLEEEIFYERLDETLSDKEKEDLISRGKEFLKK